MTDQKVTPCEFVAGLCSNCGATEQLGCEGWVAPADRVQSLAEQVDALTKEREALTANHKECVRCLGEALQDTANVSVERDALAASMYAYASEFGLDEEGHPDVGSIHQNIRALKAAATLAMDYLVYDTRDPMSNKDLARVLTAINALRQAGVQ